MKSFVLVGKAKTVFRLLELKLRYETRAGEGGNKDNGRLDRKKETE